MYSYDKYDGHDNTRKVAVAVAAGLVVGAVAVVCAVLTRKGKAD